MATQSRKPRSREPAPKLALDRTLGEVFTDARDAMKPKLGYQAIAHRLYAQSHIDISHTTVAKYHTDVVQLPDVEIVLALVDFYGLTLTDLPDGIRGRCERLRDRLAAVSRGGRAKYAPRDSNPEPADITLSGDLTANCVTSGTPGSHRSVRSAA